MPTVNFISPANCATNITFSLINPLIASGTGGGDCTINSGTIQISGLNTGDVPTLYTINVYVDSVDNAANYTVTYTAPNYFVNAISLGANNAPPDDLTAGTHNVVVVVTRISDSHVWSNTYTSTACP